MTSARPNVLSRMVNWLRAGYPEGIPDHDYVVLFGILHRSLTEAEVDQVAQQLIAGPGGIERPLTHDDIRRLIQETVLEKPGDADVRRVAGKLAEGGWPLAGMDQLADKQ